MGLPSLLGYAQGLGSPNAPDSHDVGQMYNKLTNKFLGSADNLYSTEAQFKPQYVDLQNQLTRQQLMGSLGTYGAALPMIAGLQGQAGALDVANYMKLAPGALEALRQTNPGQAALIDQLNQAASSGLAAGSRLTPEDAYRISQSVRGDWAARGLGTSDAAQLNEGIALGAGGEALRQQRQQFGTQTAALNNDLYTSPLMQWLGGTVNSGNGAMNWMGTAAGSAQGAGPTLFTSDQLANLMNNIYGQKNANARAEASNNLGYHQGMQSGENQTQSSVTSLIGAMV